MGLLCRRCLRLELGLLLAHLSHPCAVRHRSLWNTTREWLGGDRYRFWSEGRSGGWRHPRARLAFTRIAPLHGEFRPICRALTFKRWHCLRREHLALCPRNVARENSRHSCVELSHGFGGNKIYRWRGVYNKGWMSILCVLGVCGCSEPCEVGLQSASVAVMWTLALSSGLEQRRNRLLISLVICGDGSRLELHANSKNHRKLAREW
jgi:hypothetical protein